MATRKWWQTAVFYQIYPRSFADGNGDGIGDFQGMIEKLDYLKSLGIGGIWLSPHFPSPQHDCGYDISDYTGVEPEYGTLDDFKAFLDGAHRRGIRVILDLVMNHTSDEHSWFIESRSSRDNPRRDWYIWRDAKPDGSPPNNWASRFGGSAWEWDQPTQAYYYHFFLKQQPDLNWRNPEVKQAMFDAVRFWLDMGVDGFRLDAIGTVYEDPELTDHQAGITQEELFRVSSQLESEADFQRIWPLWEALFKYQVDQPGIHELMQELRSVIDEYDDRVLVGETEEIAFYGSGDDELQLVFNFPLMRTQRITPHWVRENQKNRLALLPGVSWPCNTLGNHDSPRMLSRYGDGSHDEAIARMHLVLLLALKGTPFLYNGEEIGMRDYLLQKKEDFRDLSSLFFYKMAIEVLGLSESEAVKMAAQNGRDRCRTPNQWANTANAGFAPEGVHPWLPVNPDYAQGVNAADQDRSPDSMLNFYRRAIAMRSENPALIYGDYQPVDEKNANVLAFARFASEQRCLVLLNMTGQPKTASLDLPVEPVRLVFSTHIRDDSLLAIDALDLAPYEAVVVEVK